ncbi:hypothetical protein HWX34_12205 [Aquitalea sp. LB_tupeE]|nr:hypothetical protein [Aquitalea sp. LB_tupeE]
MPRFLVPQEVSSGNLLIPCDISLPGDNGYDLVCLPDRQQSLPLRAFADWLLQQATQ